MFEWNYLEDQLNNIKNNEFSGNLLYHLRSRKQMLLDCDLIDVCFFLDMRYKYFSKLYDFKKVCSRLYAGANILNLNWKNSAWKKIDYILKMFSKKIKNL